MGLFVPESFGPPGRVTLKIRAHIWYWGQGRSASVDTLPPLLELRVHQNLQQNWDSGFPIVKFVLSLLVRAHTRGQVGPVGPDSHLASYGPFCKWKPDLTICHWPSGKCHLRGPGAEGEGAHSMRYGDCFKLGDVAVWPELRGKVWNG